MSRTAHYIQGNARSSMPVHAVWIDCESEQIRIAPDTVEHRLTFGWAAYRRRRGERWMDPQWYRFTDAGSAWRWIGDHARTHGRLYVYCHNSSFDYPLLDTWSLLPSLGWTLKGAVIDAPPTILRWRRAKECMVLLDTLNWWRQPLVALGQRLGLSKGAMPSFDDDESVWDEYCRRDVEIIMETCMRWYETLRTHDLGGYAPTLASQAMRAWRHRFMPPRVLIDIDARALALAREAYHGGRVECLRIGHSRGRYTLLDVNSMYPAVMAAHTYPSRLRSYYGAIPLTDLDHWLAHYACVARVEIETDEPVYPVVRDHRLLFPLGRFSCALTTPELHHARDAGHLVSVQNIAIYHADDLFSAWVTELYQMRQQLAQCGDEVGRWMVKILMNSLYGKFGQHGRIYEDSGSAQDLDVQAWTELNLETHTVRHCRRFGGLLQVWQDAPESRESHPAIAAHVTAHARMYLWDLMQRAGRDHVLYCDTDSLLVDAHGAKKLTPFVAPTELGRLKIEGRYNDIDIWGPKDYRFGDKQRHKGVRAKAQWLNKNTVVQEKWSSLRGLVRLGRLDRPITTTIRKRLQRLYLSGTVDASGRTHPPRLP